MPSQHLVHWWYGNIWLSLLYIQISAYISSPPHPTPPLPYFPPPLPPSCPFGKPPVYILPPFGLFRRVWLEDGIKVTDFQVTITLWASMLSVQLPPPHATVEHHLKLQNSWIMETMADSLFVAFYSGHTLKQNVTNAHWKGQTALSGKHYENMETQLCVLRKSIQDISIWLLYKRASFKVATITPCQIAAVTKHSKETYS